jgi:hypothetical protein
VVSAEQLAINYLCVASCHNLHVVQTIGRATSSECCHGAFRLAQICRFLSDYDDHREFPDWLRCVATAGDHPHVLGSREVSYKLHQQLTALITTRVQEPVYLQK